MNEKKTLFACLSALAESDKVSMHMPGHKRNAEGVDFLEALGGKYDITEITDFDSLHDPRGILKGSMERAARLWKSKESFFLVNGSTGGILSAVRAAARASGTGKIIMARNCHKSVYNAVQLCRLDPVYLMPPTVSGLGFCGSISPKSVEAAVSENPGAPVVLTSPTYEGVLSDISEIAAICHKHGSPLVVDEAHGAHLDLSAHFTGSAVGAGADLVIQSVHKTLTGLTQAAILHLNGEMILPENLRTELAVFQSTSPSYLLMASIDGTVDLIESRGTELFSAWKKRLDRFDKLVVELTRLRLPGHSEIFECQSAGLRAGYRCFGRGVDEVFGFDRSKIVISCGDTDTSGVELMKKLYDDYGVHCDMAAGGYCVAMTGVLDRNENLERLAKAIKNLDSLIGKGSRRTDLDPISIPPVIMSVSAALSEEYTAVAPKKALGKIAAEYVYAYPPGIPLIVPGEKVTEEIISGFNARSESGLVLKSSSGGMPGSMRVVV